MISLTSLVEPYRVTTEEVKKSVDWLRDAYKTDELAMSCQRSEVRETRFKFYDIPSIKDEDILRKFHEAQLLNIHHTSNK